MKKINKDFSFYSDIFNKPENNWLLPIIKEYICNQTEKAERIKKAYENLFNMIKEKEYFIVTQNYDSFIWQSPIKKDRIVAPCGTVMHFQCENGCQEVWEDRKYLKDVFDRLNDKKWDISQLKKPVCPICKKTGICNIISSKDYHESGYLEQWEKYKNWLVHTLNRKLCIIELGVGLQYPTVIRWPFEKIAYVNQKAVFFRVHSTLYQLSEQMQDRGISIKEEPINLLY